MDLGYHFDLTDFVLREVGFSTVSIKLAQYANGLTDIFGNLPNWPNFPDLVSQTSRLHCDNLFLNDHLTKYWSQLLGNLKKELTNAAKEFKNAPTNSVPLLEGLYCIGAVLHTVQDLVSHSTWCETRPPISGVSLDNPRIVTYLGDSLFQKDQVLASNDIRTELFDPYYVSKDPKAKKWIDTWFDNTDPSIAGVRSHENKEDSALAQNLDHQDRYIKLKDAGARLTYWDEAYVASLSTARHFIVQVCEWTKGDFLNALKNPTIPDNLSDQASERLFLLRALSLYVLEGMGHWKGPGSADVARFLRALDPFLTGELRYAWQKDQDNVPEIFKLFRNVMKKDRLTRHLYVRATMGIASSDNILPVISVDAPSSDFIVLTVLVHSVSMFTPVGESGSKPEYTPKPFLEVIYENPVNGMFPGTEYFYRERSVQLLRAENIDKNNSTAKFTLNREYLKNEPWQVVHFVPKNAKIVRCRIHLRNELLGSSEREFRIRPMDSDPAKDHIEFTVNLGATPELVSDSLTNQFQGDPLKVAKSETDTLNKWTVEGKNVKDAFHGDLATIEFSVYASEIKP